ncbi:hypothetical protein [Mycobacterium arosiense]|uniref:ABM domain-containing protein n=1 Tax=Mycobacterium arosiense ATCC BAA-1401 = DSM 45069 TaxID=1265311 RepID=A0A1W9ZNU5_MYCAI|nr:hypothetical protein [Mycobacterium arosiense]ORA19489.1 hypothetical protein BST14_05480 [Mycobacterium arosiense ATCC BAA-1401 = DSM 45069]
MTQVQQEADCDLAALRAAAGTWMLIELWPDTKAFNKHNLALGVTTLRGEVGEYRNGAQDVEISQSVVSGNPADGELGG